MSLQGRIAKAAQSEIPEEWTALEHSTNYGPNFLTQKVQSVMLSLWGRLLTVDEDRELDIALADYAGKRVAYSLINPSISYWSKQAISISATGRNENKSYADRAAYLRVIRENLAADLAAAWPEVEILLPDRRYKRNVSVPTVFQAGDNVPHKTPHPDDFDPAFDPVVPRRVI